MSRTGGDRHELSLFDYVKKENIEIHWETRRIGNPWAEQLKILMPKLISIADHETNYEILHWNRFD